MSAQPSHSSFFPATENAAPDAGKDDKPLSMPADQAARRLTSLELCQRSIDIAEGHLLTALTHAQASDTPAAIIKVTRLLKKTATAKSRLTHKRKAIENYYKGEFCFDGD